MAIMTFSELFRLPSHKFRYDNMVRYLKISIQCRYRDENTIVVSKPWEIIGWSDKIEPNLMIGREGQVGIMYWNPEEGEAWEHWPIFEEDRNEVVFVEGA
jgi:hypothetical protein